MAPGDMAELVGGDGLELGLREAAVQDRVVEDDALRRPESRRRTRSRSVVLLLASATSTLSTVTPSFAPSSLMSAVSRGFSSGWNVLKSGWIRSGCAMK